MVHYTGNEVFVSTRDNRLYELQPGAQSWGQAPGAKPSEPVPMTVLPSTPYAFLKDSKGHEWMGTRGGGLYLDRKPIEFPSTQIYNILEDPSGRLWISTWGDGLFVVRLNPN